MGGAPNSLRLTSEEKRCLDYNSTGNNTFDMLNKDTEFRSILGALFKLQRDITRMDAAGHVRLDVEFQEESMERTPTGPAIEHRGKSSIAIRASDASHQSARWGHTCKKSSGSGSLHLNADIEYDRSGNMAIRLAIKSHAYRYSGDGDQFYKRKFEGPTAVIQELSSIIVRNNGDLAYMDLHPIKCLIFLRSLCGVVASVFRENDPRRQAEFRWAASATGVGEAVELKTYTQEAMAYAWDASQLSTDCPDCQTRHVSQGPERLVEISTWTPMERTDVDYAAISYCWSSVASNEDLRRQVETATQDTPINYVWIDRSCLSDEPTARQKEVHRMSEIYAKARLVIILPGTQITELDNLLYDANGTAIRVTEENSRRIGEQWTQAEWRSRCWTFQEASMARATAVVTGSRKQPVLSGAALDALATCGMGGSVKLTPRHPLDDTWLRANTHTYKVDLDDKYHMFERSHQVCGACGLPQDLPPKKQQLLVLMALSWHRRASKEQDTVYSLLSMALNGDKIPVRYDVTLEELYRVLIETKVIGAEIMALGGGYVGKRTSWIPSRGEYEQDRWERLSFVSAGVTEKNTLLTAAIPVTLLNEHEDTYLRLAGVHIPLYVTDEDRVLTGIMDEWQAHALAPLTRVRRSNWKLVLIFSSAGEGGIRHVEKVHVCEGEYPRKRGMESLAIEMVEYASQIKGNEQQIRTESPHYECLVPINPSR